MINTPFLCSQLIGFPPRRDASAFEILSDASAYETWNYFGVRPEGLSSKLETGKANAVGVCVEDNVLEELLMNGCCMSWKVPMPARPGDWATGKFTPGTALSLRLLPRKAWFDIMGWKV